MNRLIVALVVGVAFASCEIVTSDNGDLDGFWQLTGVDTLSTGGNRPMKENRIFWGVQAGLLRTMSPDGNVFFRFDHSGGQLRLSEPYVDNRDSSDIKVTDVAILRPYGVNALEETYDVLELSSGTMVLQSPMLKLYFRQY